MRFSIIIPVHNGQEYIEDCMNSAISECRAFAYRGEAEVLVVENGSSDETAAICDKFAGINRELRVLHEGAIGLYQARQVGISAAKGEWIIALDADDRLVSGMLECLDDKITEIEKRGEKADFILYGAAPMGNPEGRLTDFSFDEDKVYAGADKKVFMDRICQDDSLNAMWIKALHRDIAFLDREIKGLNYGEDLFQTAEYIDRAQGIACIDKALYLYRDNAASLSATYNRAYMDNQKLVWSELDRLIDKWGDKSYEDMLTPRKALTCSIAVGKIIYSSLAGAEKRKVLSELLEDPFYQKYGRQDLPDWAPEADVFVHSLQMNDDPFKALMGNARSHAIRSGIKKLLGRRK